MMGAECANVVCQYPGELFDIPRCMYTRALLAFRRKHVPHVGLSREGWVMDQWYLDWVTYGAGEVEKVRIGCGGSGCVGELWTP